MSRLAAEIVTSGTEILLGEIVDTNAAWIAQQLREAGVHLYYKTTVGDNEARLRTVLELGMSRSDVIIITGGLGPTADDVTRQAIANATNRPLLLHDEALQTLKERFARFGVTMTENNRQQALIPTDAILIENPVGTAPGFIVEGEQGTIIALPGVPREMKRLMQDTVLPYLRTRSENTGIIRRRVLRTVSIGESTVDHHISDLMQGANPSVGLAAHTAQVDIRVTASADSPDVAEAMIDEVEQEIRRRIGDYIFSNIAGETIEFVVVHLLRASSATISIVESNTGGALAQRLSKVEEENAQLEAEDKAEEDGVVGEYWLSDAEDLPPAVRMILDNDTVLGEEQIVRCAEALRVLSDATYGLAILGTSGTDQGIYGNQQGETWIALASPETSQSWHVGFGGQDEYTIVRLSNHALSALWRELR
ncbi:CinA family nicotinamide mononucleotide deamidase-related protein [Chloroflexi bacterium TSY]|nr:CinA family nicotinamide mononucleotide deamidase-related protein [Chloroflexi bacterium TSY]